MPQLFQVLKCFKCSVFQVHQTKKSNKWQCKVCGEKQSIKRHYGIGTAKECRLHVQKLNGIRGEIDEASEIAQLNKSSDDEPEINVVTGTIKKPVRKPCKNSKWSNFVDKEPDDIKQNTDESMYIGNVEVVLEIPAKKRKKFKPPKVAMEDQPNASTTITTMSLDYEPVEPVFTQTESSESDVYGNSFFKTHKCKPQTKITKPIAPTFCPAKENIQITKKHKISTQLNIEHSLQEPRTQVTKEIKMYVLPKVNKSSKWAEYAEDDEENVNENLESIDTEHITHNIPINQDISDRSQNIILSGQQMKQNVSFSIKNLSQTVSTSLDKSSNNNIKQLFTLCDESELDDVLDF